ncbi:hypothetical protein [Cognaticolwellia mytili]|nr:hypothetical protein [Cognaticolwellia mytili]
MTTIALDPNFNYPDRKGFNTLYTAHVEHHSSNEFSKSAALPYNAVIMR